MCRSVLACRPSVSTFKGRKRRSMPRRVGAPTMRPLRIALLWCGRFLLRSRVHCQRRKQKTFSFRRK